MACVPLGRLGGREGFHDFLDVTWDVIDDDPEAEVQAESHELQEALKKSLAANERLLQMLVESS